MEFNATYAPIGTFLGYYFDKELRSLIKLWINKKGQKLLLWDNFVKKSSRAESKAKIQNNWDLDPHCPLGKHPLKLIKKNREDQEKFYPKSPTPPKKLQAEKSEFSEKTEKAKKKKKKNRREWQREGSTSATQSNTKNPAVRKHKENKNVTCYNYNKKEHYINECSKLGKPKD